MGQIRQAAPVKLFAGILASREQAALRAEELLAERYGPVDLRSEWYPFDSTSYYDAEMGTPTTYDVGRLCVK